MRDRSDPFAQLERSHRRLEERLDDLVRAGDDPAILRDVAAFFARAVRRHEDDEERSLFPRLAGRPELATVLERLAREHRDHEALHAKLDDVVRMLDAGEAAPLREVEALSDALVRAYRVHIDDEEREVFPAARAILGAPELEAMVREMQERRGR